MSSTARISASTLVLALLISIAGARPASAQGFVSPFIGYNFGGDSGCLEITNCEDKNLNWGVAFGALGSVVGFEAEFAYIPDFFGEIPGSDSSVTTFMGNFMLAPRFGPIQPYGLAGLGLIRTNAEFGTAAVSTDETDNNFGYDIGGGLIVMFGRNFGIRGDVRYFHALQVADILGFDLGDTKIDYGRFSGALMVKF